MNTAEPSAAPSEHESLAELIGDSRRMAPHWQVPPPPKLPAVAWSSLRGITVPTASAQVVDGMAQYQD